MSDLAIRVENLSKRYKIGTRKPRHDTLRDHLAHGFKHLFSHNGKPSTSARPPSVGNVPSDVDGLSDFIWALKDLVLEVKHGEVVGIIGRNGAGKSTLLKILSRITKPTKGRVNIYGRIGSLLEVGTGFHPELTGRENIFLNGAILGMKRGEIERKFEEIVDFSEIEKFIDTPVKRYSSGMYVRLAFAVAAHLEPDILVLDEVLAVGDTLFQEKCMDTIQKTASHGRTVLLVSHNMASIQHLCKRAIVLKEGRIVADGSPEEAVNSYLLESSFGPGQESTSLRDWPDRESNGQARITLLQIRNSEGELTSTIALGQRASFVIYAEFYDPILDPNFGVIVHGRSGEPILELRSDHAGIRLGKVKGQFVVEVSVDALGLYPGEYFLSPWIADRACRENLDWTKLCCTFRMAPAVGPHGELTLDPAWGKYWVPSNWNIHVPADCSTNRHTFGS
jgi:lipopolysaccharide transport system ATP-binding protein